MGLVKINKDTLTEIADAIRIRNKSTDKYFLKDMPQAVRDIYNNPKSTYQGTEADVIALGDYTEETYENLEITALGDNALYGVGVTNLILPNVQVVGEYACAGLPITKIDEYDFSYAMELKDYAFRSCKNLKTAHFPMAKKVGYRTFMYCEALEAIYLPNIEKIDIYAFQYGCDNLKDIYLGMSASDFPSGRYYPDMGTSEARPTVHYDYVG